MRCYSNKKVSDRQIIENFYRAVFEFDWDSSEFWNSIARRSRSKKLRKFDLYLIDPCYVIEKGIEDSKIIRKNICNFDDHYKSAMMMESEIYFDKMSIILRVNGENSRVKEFFNSIRGNGDIDTLDIFSSFHDTYLNIHSQSSKFNGDTIVFTLYNKGDYYCLTEKHIRWLIKHWSEVYPELSFDISGRIYSYYDIYNRILYKVYKSSEEDFEKMLPIDTLIINSRDTIASYNPIQYNVEIHRYSNGDLIECFKDSIIL